MDSEKFNNKKEYYLDNYSLGYIGTISEKLQLISLICYTKQRINQKDPEMTYLEVINLIDKEKFLPEVMKENLAIICEDFAYCCNDFPLFGIKSTEVLNTIRKIFKTYVPF